MQTPKLSCYSRQAFQDTKMVLWQEDGSDNPVEFNISIVHMRFVIHWLFFSPSY